MAELPTVGSRQRLIPESRRGIARISTQAADEAAIAGARRFQQGMGDIAAGLDNIAVAAGRVEKAKQEAAYTDARTKWLQAKVVEDAAYDEDPAWATYETRYSQNLGKVKEQLASSLSDPTMRAKFASQADLDLTEGRVNIGRLARDKEVKQGTERLKLSLTEGINAAVAARDPATRTAIFDNLNTAINAAINANYLSPEQAALTRLELGETYATKFFDTVEPETALSMLIPGAQQEGISVAPLITNDAEVLQRIAQLESSDNPSAVNPVTGAFGRLQLHPKTAAEFGITKDSSEKEYMNAALKLYNRNKAQLTSILGRAPKPEELYLAWQQGVGGAAALLGNPDQPAITALLKSYDNDLSVARQAILANGGTEGMTAGQFANLWAAKFNGADTTKIGEAFTIPVDGYDFSQKNGTPADYLPADKRTELIRQNLKAMEDKANTAKAALQTSIALEWADSTRNAQLTGQVDGTLVGQIAYAYPAAQAGKMIADLTASAQLGRDLDDIRSQNIKSDEAMLFGASVAAQEPGPDSAAKFERYKQISAAVAEKWKAISEDPVAYAASQSGALEDAIMGARLTPQDPMAMQTAINMAISEQHKLGIPEASQRAFTKGDAESIVADIMKGTPKQQFQTMMQYLNTGNEALSRKAMRDLAAVENGLPAGADIIADIAIETGNMELAADLWDRNIAGSKIKDQDVGVTPEINLNVRNYLLETGQLGSVILNQNAAAGNWQIALDNFDYLDEVVKNVAKTYALAGEDFEAGAQKAAAQISSSLHVLDTENTKVYFPAKYDPELIDMGLNQLRKTLAEPFGQRVNDPAAAYGQDIVNAGIWVNNGSTGFSMLLPNGSKLALPTEYSFEQVLAVGQREKDRLYGEAMEKRKIREGQ